MTLGLAMISWMLSMSTHVRLFATQWTAACRHMKCPSPFHGYDAKNLGKKAKKKKKKKRGSKKWDYTKLKNFRTTQQRKQSTELNGNFWNGRKYLQTLCLIRG